MRGLQFGQTGEWPTQTNLKTGQQMMEEILAIILKILLAEWQKMTMRMPYREGKRFGLSSTAQAKIKVKN